MPRNPACSTPRRQQLPLPPIFLITGLNGCVIFHRADPMIYNHPPPEVCILLLSLAVSLGHLQFSEATDKTAISTIAALLLGMLQA